MTKNDLKWCKTTKKSKVLLTERPTDLPKDQQSELLSHVYATKKK